MTISINWIINTLKSDRSNILEIVLPSSERCQWRKVYSFINSFNLTSHCQCVSVIIGFIVYRLASVTIISLKSIVSQHNRFKWRQVYFIISFSHLLSNIVVWIFWNAWLSIFTLCSSGKSTNSRYLYFMNDNSPISILIKCEQYVTRSLPLPPFNPPRIITNLSNASNPINSNTETPVNALIPIVRFFMDCCWFNVIIFCFDIGKFTIHTSSISFDTPFNSDWFRITSLDDGICWLKLI